MIPRLSHVKCVVFFEIIRSHLYTFSVSKTNLCLCGNAFSLVASRGVRLRTKVLIRVMRLTPRLNRSVNSRIFGSDTFMTVRITLRSIGLHSVLRRTSRRTNITRVSLGNVLFHVPVRERLNGKRVITPYSSTDILSPLRTSNVFYKNKTFFCGKVLRFFIFLNGLTKGKLRALLSTKLVLFLHMLCRIILVKAGSIPLSARSLVRLSTNRGNLSDVQRSSRGNVLRRGLPRPIIRHFQREKAKIREPLRRHGSEFNSIVNPWRFFGVR